MEISIIDPSTLVRVSGGLDILNHLWEPKGPAVGGDRCRPACVSPMKVFTFERGQ